MTASQAKVSYNDQMWIGRTDEGVTTWTQILGLEPLPFPEQIPEEIDVTHQQSPGRTRETIPGLLPVVSASVEKQMWIGHAGDTLLITLADLTAAGTPEDVLVEFMVDHATAPLRRTYRSHVKAYTPTPSVGEKRMVTVAIDIFNKVANSRVIA